MIKPLGYYVLIEMEEIKEVSAGGIIMPSDLIAKEQDATDTGFVRAFGPTAYVGYPGCDGDSINTSSLLPHENWGLKIGDKIEYRRFEGKKSTAHGYENYRYIPDSHIIGVIEED